MSVAPPTIHNLSIAEIRREAPDAVAIRFAVPEELRAAFTFSAGQYLTLCRDFDGEELRRCYSISSRPGASGPWVGVREEKGGRFSGWLNRDAKVGDTLAVMTPDGRFTFQPEPDGPAREGLCVAAGSGITPMLSILETLLANEPQKPRHADLRQSRRNPHHVPRSIGGFEGPIPRSVARLPHPQP